MNILGVALGLIATIGIVGLVLYAVNRWVKMQDSAKNLMNWVVIGFLAIVLIIWLLKITGLWQAITMPRL